MANMIPISTIVLASTSATISFTSIPQGYTDLLVKVSARSTAGNGSYLAVIINGSSTSFNSRVLYGNGSSAGSYAGSGNDRQYAGYISASTSSTSMFSNTEIYFPDYTSANNKSFSSDSVGENNATGVEMGISAGLWSQTALITSITFDIFDAGDFVPYTTATLYGIRKY